MFEYWSEDGKATPLSILILWLLSTKTLSQATE
jgi:hypothetical protein